MLSLIVPTRDEHANVAPLVKRLARVLGAQRYEILFVDDSDDDTPAAIRREMVVDPCVRLLHREPNERVGGLATAVVAGIGAARGEYLGVIDGDLQHPPEVLPTMLSALDEADLVVASRHITGGSSAGLGGPVRRIVSRGSRMAASTLFHRVRACTDPMSGFFLFRREVIQGIDLRPQGFKILLEILVRGRWARLTEIPFTFADRRTGASKADLAQGVAYLRHLAELRFSGARGHGALRYWRQRLPVEADAPQPLDDELPDAPEVAGQRRRRVLWTIALLALALRLVLLPIGHWWDLTVDYNVFIDLAHNHSPYDTMSYLSHVARAAGWDVNYEYYAYPPVPLYLYYLPAKLYALLHPDATYFIPVSSTFAMPSLSLDFFFLLKAPIWAADFLVAALLARMSGTIRGWRDYLVNPYVLLVSGAWTFDAVMVLGLLAAAYYIQLGRIGRSALALAFGTMVKFIPAIAAPTLVLYLIKKKRPLREIALFLGIYAMACALLIGPFSQGLLYVLGFHSERVGGGMNWEMFWRLGAFFPKGTELDPISLAIGAFGTPTLLILLLLAYWHAFTSERMGLNRMILVTLLAFFVGSKLVNEQYALVAFPFAFLEAYRVRGAWRWFARLLWIIPLLYAVVRTPIDRFFWLFYHMVLGTSADAIAVTGKTGFEGPLTPWIPGGVFTQIEILVFGLAFWGLCIVALVWPVRRAQRLVRHQSVGAVVEVPLALPAWEPAPVLESDVAPEPEPEVAVPR